MRLRRLARKHERSIAVVGLVGLTVAGLASGSMALILVVFILSMSLGMMMEVEG